MAGELSDRLIDTGARMAARQAYLLNSISERFSSEDTIGKMSQEKGQELDEFETYMLMNPVYDDIRNAIQPAFQQAVQSMNPQNEAQ